MSNEGIINPSSNIYYKIKITFDLVVEDSGSSDHSRMALSQATSYAVMDYFNQYTYASVTANMIGEIAYTEILTLISTLITAPVLLIGGWTTEGVKKFIGKIGVKGVAAKILKGVLIAGKIINSIVVTIKYNTQKKKTSVLLSFLRIVNRPVIALNITNTAKTMFNAIGVV